MCSALDVLPNRFDIAGENASLVTSDGSVPPPDLALIGAIASFKFDKTTFDGRALVEVDDIREWRRLVG
jgi:hypothetical protein